MDAESEKKYIYANIRSHIYIYIHICAKCSLASTPLTWLCLSLSLSIYIYIYKALATAYEGENMFLSTAVTSALRFAFWHGPHNSTLKFVALPKPASEWSLIPKLTIVNVLLQHVIVGQSC